MDVLRAYFERINWREIFSTPDLDTLLKLHDAQVHSIPFERLDRYFKIPVHLDPHSLLNKLVTRKRGGGCYELNGLFHLVLQSLGFKSRMCSAQLIREDGSLVEGSVHMVLLVELSETWLVDVGYGGTLLAPHPFCQSLTKHYRIDPQPREMAFFEPRNRLHSSEESPVGTVPYCWLPTKEGYKLLRGSTFFEKNATSMREIELRTAQEYETLLQEKFGLRVPFCFRD